MTQENVMTEQDKQDTLIKNYDKSNNLNVPIKRCRFPLQDGIQQKITLVSNVTGRFKNIYFVKGIENTINGAIADDLLDRFPEMFSVYKINGRLVSKGKENSEKERIKLELMEELKREFDIKPKETKDTKRDRVDSVKSNSKSKYQKIE